MQLSVKTTRWLWIVLLIFYGCSSNKKENLPQAIVQFSTIDALMTGVYDGTTTLDDLSSWGDFGIGTFQSLDGEMVLLNGIFYQVKADGNIYKPADTLRTPFASVTFFEPERQFSIESLSFAEFKTTIDSIMVSSNLFYALRLQGTFNHVKTRSVPSQKKPYRPLVEVTAFQPEFESDTVKGTLSGFFCPPFVTGVNVPGYHLHFISEDETFGGHVLEFSLDEGVLEIDQIDQFRLMLPNEGNFLEADLTSDLSEDLEKVEGS